MKVKNIIEQRNDSMKRELGRMLALYAGQWLLTSRKNRTVGPLRIVSGAAVLFVGATGRVPFAHLLKRMNENHGQLNCKVDTLIQQPPATVFAIFRHFVHIKDQLPVGRKVEALRGSSDGCRIYVSFFGVECTWDLFIVKERAGEFLGWSTADDTLFYNTGKVELTPGELPEHTVLDFVFSYTPPGGKLGVALVRPFHAMVQGSVERYIDRVKKALEYRVYA